jgi:predicted MFS family arabinose efflux permease
MKSSNERHHPAVGLTQGAVLIFAVAAGLNVANIYYAQPLLETMAKDFQVSPSTIGLVVTMAQVGYAFGLIFIVPLGDLIDRRSLIIGQIFLSALALIAIATAPTRTVLLISMGLMGMLAVAVQVIVAFAATLATPSEGGKVVGIVTSGVVIGILAARFVAGVIADFGGWRAVYLTSAVLMLGLAGVLMLVLPQQQASRSADSYLTALVSIPTLFLRDQVLLARGILALLIFAAFSTFWTALVLPLSAPPFSYSHSRIGLFGLVGLAGAIAATGAGRLADRGFGRPVTGVSLVILVLSWGLIALLPLSIAVLVIGVVLLDFAVQAVHVTNQSVIIARHNGARSRLVGGYMTFYSVGSAIGATAATLIYARASWTGVSLLGASFSGIALFVWLITRHLDSSATDN